MIRYKDDAYQQPQLFKRLLDLPIFQEQRSKEALSPLEEQEVDSAAYIGWAELPEKLPALQDSSGHNSEFLFVDTGARRSSGIEAQNRAESYSTEYRQQKGPRSIGPGEEDFRQIEN